MIECFLLTSLNKNIRHFGAHALKLYG